MSMWQDIFAVKIEEMHITDLWTLLEDDGLQLQACRPGWKEFVQRRALGRFQCSQCFNNWTSAKVHILFHMYHCQGWGTVWMRIFRQKCRRCPNSRLEDPEFSLDTVETILHNLVIKILQYFYKKPVQPSDLLEVVVDTPVTGPHDRDHCEACELGICSRSQKAPALDAGKPLADEDKARMHSSEPWLAWPSDVWSFLTNTREAGTHNVESRLSLGSDDFKPLIDVGKARTHRTKLQPAPARVAQKKKKSRTSQTLKHQGLRPHEASTHHPSPSNSNFSWKWCCCIGSSLLCVLALIIFVVLYLTIR
ncbi:receptor-transporting protein 3-like [Motacilla alba alba]|uniref:receptor-transporting protein 3-like n=1 Tax=Motacilla alba alba TaxID=1094192 RepID=UPI0018D551F3|nr:receptor-transporting protein 3-like [Motacilla alba alba]